MWQKFITAIGLSDGEGGLSSRRLIGYLVFAGIAVLVFLGKINLESANQIWGMVAAIVGVEISIGLDSFVKNTRQ